MTNTEDYRPLSARERSLLDRLLERAFPGRDAIRVQAQQSLVREFDDPDNYGSIGFRVPASTPSAAGSRVPVEGLAQDDDGVPIEVLLHMRHGYISELEVVKADGTPIHRFPAAAEFKVSVRVP